MLVRSPHTYSVLAMLRNGSPIRMAIQKFGMMQRGPHRSGGPHQSTISLECLRSCRMWPYIERRLLATQVALQNFAWTERSRDGTQAERAAQCSTDAQREAALAEPVFCFETACKALYWSFLVYRLQAR